MVYDRAQIKNYSSILAFASSTELFALLSTSDKVLADKITKFHIFVTILSTIQSLQESSREVNIESMKAHMMTSIFKGHIRPSELERKLELFIPALVSENLLTEDLIITTLGKQAMVDKVAAHYLSNLYQDILN